MPAYVSAAPSPKAALALVERTARLLGANVELGELEIAAAAYERQVSEVVAQDDDVTASVQHLEELDAAGEDEGVLDWPPGDGLVDEAERFLRDQSPE